MSRSHVSPDSRGGLISSAIVRRWAVWRRSVSFVIVALQTTSFASPLLAGFIQTSVSIKARADVTIMHPVVGRITDSDGNNATFEPPPSLLFPATVNANAGFSSAGANATIDTTGNLGLRTVLTSRDVFSSAEVLFEPRYRNQNSAPVNVEIQWLLGPVNIRLFGARNTSVRVGAGTIFDFGELVTASAELTLGVDADGNVTPTSGLTINGQVQPLPPFVTDGDSVSLNDYFIPIPFDFIVPAPTNQLLNQITNIRVSASTGSDSPELVLVTLDDPFNLSGNPATSVHFIDSEPDTAPVPEPSSLTLLACGLITLSGYARRKRNQRRRTPAQLPKHHNHGTVS